MNSKQTTVQRGLEAYKQLPYACSYNNYDLLPWSGGRSRCLNKFNLYILLFCSNSLFTICYQVANPAFEPTRWLLLIHLTTLSS